MTDACWRTALVASLLLASGCTIGNGRICGPQTPVIYCDAEALNALLNPPAYITRWEKIGVSPSEKLADWIACGGRSDGDFVPSEELKELARRREDGSLLSPYQKAEAQFQRCFLGKGYVWKGGCRYPSNNAFPICGAP